MMRVRPTRRSVSVVITVLLVGALLGIVYSGAAVAAPQQGSTLAGTWSGKYSGAFSGTFTLRWTQTGSRLSGSITLSNPHGRYGIGGSVRRNAIKFGAVGVGAKYTGSVSGTSMSGSYTSPQGGGKWSAYKIRVRSKS
jgi:hypothetical protein